MPSFNEFLCLMETGPYLPENSCNVCYWKAKRKTAFKMPASYEEKHGFVLDRKTSYSTKHTLSLGEYFMALLPLQFPSQGPETHPRWRSFGAQFTPLQEDNARFFEEKWLTS